MSIYPWPFTIKTNPDLLGMGLNMKNRLNMVDM